MSDRFYREPEGPWPDASESEPDPVEEAREAARASALEPVAVTARPDHDGQVRLSMAISLKRIADQLSPLERGDPETPYTIHDLVDVIAEAYA